MSELDEKAPVTPEPHTDNEGRAPLIGSKSPGVERIEAISAHISFWDRIAIFFSVFLIAYAYGLDGTLRYVYQVRGSSFHQPYAM
jgi:MFS transporter, SIT family, siderophore-iron:H+ symporter